jgi:hypothetical protein
MNVNCSWSYAKRAETRSRFTVSGTAEGHAETKRSTKIQNTWRWAHVTKTIAFVGYITQDTTSQHTLVSTYERQI